jgi:hypothetical protein
VCINLYLNLACFCSSLMCGVLVGVCACMLILCIVFIFTMLEPNVDGFDEKGDFEDFEDTRDKPPKASHLYLLHTFILVLLMKVFHLCFTQSALF